MQIEAVVPAGVKSTIAQRIGNPNALKKTGFRQPNGRASNGNQRAPARNNTNRKNGNKGGNGTQRRPVNKRNPRYGQTQIDGRLRGNSVK